MEDRRPMTTAVPSLLLPEGTRLVHIGPSKTGTTAIQASFHARREALLAQGVRYAGRSRSPWKAALAVSSSHPLAASRVAPAAEEWLELVAEVGRAEEPRLVISSEHFAKANATAIRRIAADLDRDRIHVAVTLRPLARIIPSRWQQDVQMGLPTSFDRWLDHVLNQPSSRIARVFWREHRHDALVARWAEAIGAERVTAIVLDEQDHEHALRVFEQLTGLTAGTLVAVRDLANRSLTLPEIEAVRALNERLRADGTSEPQLERVVRHRAADYLKGRRPPPFEARIDVPAWAHERTLELASAMVEGIAWTGVRVVGDLDSLKVAPTVRRDDGEPANPDPTSEIGAWLAVGMYRGAAGLTQPARKRAGVPGRSRGSIRRLAAVTIRRVWRRAADRAVALRGIAR
jgi:hypothetical protein